MSEPIQCPCPEMIVLQTEHKRVLADLMAIDADFKNLRRDFDAMRVSFALLEQRVAFYAGMGGIAGGFVASLVGLAAQKFIFGG